MSEATLTNPAEVSPYPKVVERDGVTYQLQSFESGTKFAGFYFYTKEYKDLEAFRTQLKAIKPDVNPDDIAIALINSTVAAKIRQKVTANKLGNDVEEEELQKRLARGENLVMSVDDTEKYLPGEREPYSESGILKRIKELKDLMAEARTNGVAEDSAEIVAWKAEGKFLVKKLEEIRTRTASLFE